MENIKTNFYSNIIQNKEKTFQQKKKCFCKIYKNAHEKGFGFLCKIPFPDQLNFYSALIINSHILSVLDIKNDKMLEISLIGEKQLKTIKIDDSRKIYSSEEFDITIIEIRENMDKINDFLEIDDKINEDIKYLNELYCNKPIYITNYYENNNMIFSNGILKKINGDYIFYNSFSKIKMDFSFSPILLLVNFKIIGFLSQSLNNYNNKGIFIKYPILKFIFNNEMEKLNKEKLNELTIIYKIENYKKVQIFHKHFINNNKDKCKIIVDGQEIREICSEIVVNESMKKKKKLEIKLIELKNIDNMFCMFAECSSLITLPDIGKWDLSNVKEIRSMFYNCTSLVSLNGISEWNTKNIVNMRGVFSFIA